MRNYQSVAFPKRSAYSKYITFYVEKHALYLLNYLKYWKMCLKIIKTIIKQTRASWDLARALSIGKCNSKYSVVNLQASLKGEVTAVGAYIFKRTLGRPRGGLGIPHFWYLNKPKEAKSTKTAGQPSLFDLRIMKVSLKV